MTIMFLYYFKCNIFINKYFTILHTKIENQVTLLFNHQNFIEVQIKIVDQISIVI